MRKIQIRSRLGEYPGLTDENVAIFDRFDPKANRVIRHYIFLNEAAKLMHEPWGWVDRWYVDLVDIHWVSEEILELTDLYLDVIVEGNGPTYRLIDLEDLAEAFLAGAVTAETMYAPLHGLQRFLDNHLHGGIDFPPAAIRAFNGIVL